MGSFSIKNSKLLYSFSTLLLFSFPILPFAVRSIAMGVWVFAAILYLILNRKEIKFEKKKIPQLIIITLPFLLLAFSLLYTENQKRGGDLIVRILPLILCPVLFYLCRNLLTERLLKIGKTIFVLATFSIVAYSFIQTFNHFDYLNRPFSDIEYQYNGLTPETITKEKEAEIKYRRFKVFIEETSGTHSTYLGIYILFSLFLIGEFLFDKKQKIGLKILATILGISMFAWLAYISVRAPLLAFLASALFVLILKVRKPKFILGTMVSALLIGFLLYQIVPNLQLRVNEVIENKLSIPESGNDPLLFNSTNVRLGSLYCSTEVFKSNWLLGVGAGDVQDKLDQCYDEKIGAIIYTWDTYNNHNQYLFFATATGIIGLLSFIGMMIYLIVLSVKRNHGTAIFFLSSSAILFLTENVLVRSDGIMYFAVIGYFLLFFKSEKK